ncbi:MAG: bifunctional DNA primase/polymerase, partial [Actinomycetota bacterium]|nr:bifunctional DNA primase/polymerase [Actinomycetota bacterium]
MQDAGTCGCGNRCEPGSRGKHPIGARWQERASADPAQVAQWARTHPGCNWGVATGEASDLYVADLDLGEDGEPLGEQTWVALFGPIPDTHRVRTGSGATQVYFRYPRRARADGRPWRNTAKLIGPGIDTRGEGGQCVLPGSTSGKGTYELIADRPLLDVPNAVLDRIEAAEREAKATRRGAGPRPDGAAVAATDPHVQLVRDGVHPWARRAFECVVGEFRALIGEGNGRTGKLAGAALRLSSLANATPPTGLTETMIRAALLEAAEANGYIAAHGIAPTEYQVARGLDDGRNQHPAGWPPPERPTGTWELTEADVRDRLAAGATPGELHTELLLIDGPSLVDRLGVRALLGVVPDPSPEPAHDPPADADPREAAESAGGWTLDVAAPTLDPARAEVFAEWVAGQVARHLAATAQGTETAVSVTKWARERWGACAPLRCRGCAIAGLGYYSESNLNVEEVCERFVAAAAGSGAEDLAELTPEQLADAFCAGWAAGLSEPMLPMAADDPARPARGRGKRGVLPSAEEMRTQITRPAAQPYLEPPADPVKRAEQIGVQLGEVSTLRAQLLDDLRVWLHLPDPAHIWVALGAAVTAVETDTAPVWVQIVAASSLGKTESTDLLGGVQVGSLGEITPAGLLAWSKGKAPRPTGLLAGITRGVVVFADFSTLLAGSERGGGRDQVFAMLRQVYDGQVTRTVQSPGAGEDALLSWQGRLTIISAVTTEIDRQLAHAQALGERWLY